MGRYASNNNYFASAATTRGPLTALRNGTDGSNGVYRYGATGFPNASFQSSNYWVDVVFDTTATDTTAPTVSSKSPADGSNGVPTSSAVTAGFSEPVVASSVSMELRNPSNAVVPGDHGLRLREPDRDPDAQRDAGHVDRLHSDRERSEGPRGQHHGPGHVVVHHGGTAAAPARPGTGWPDRRRDVSSSNPYSTYLTEILRTEGLNEFATIDVSTLSAAKLAPYDTVVLGDVTVTAAQTTDLTHLGQRPAAI